MAIDTKNIPNKPPFDDIREALLDLEEQIDDTGGSVTNSTITITAGTNMTGGGSFTLNQSSNEEITLNASDQSMTDAEIKTAYENNNNTNAFTDSEKTKLGNISSVGSGSIITTSERTKLTSIEESADVTDTDNVTTAINSISVTAHNDVSDAGSGFIITGTERTKLTNIEAGADVTDATNVAAAGAIMDGDFTSNGIMKRTGVGAYATATAGDINNLNIDADKLDGQHGSYYLNYNNLSNTPSIPSVIDEDDMASDSAVSVPTQQSVKAYVDSRDTDDITEGSSNLYHTTTRVNSVISATVNQSFVNQLNVDADTLDGNDSLYYLNYNNLSNTPTIPTTSDDLTEGSTNLFFTNARADARVSAATGSNLDLSAKTTNDLSEGTTNLYYTDARADARIANNIIDEDTMSTNSETRAPSQQSVKAYVDSQVATKDSLSELSGDTDDVNEGTTNLYHTAARVRSVVSNQLVESTAITIGAVGDTLEISADVRNLDATPIVDGLAYYSDITTYFNSNSATIGFLDADTTVTAPSAREVYFVNGTGINLTFTPDDTDNSDYDSLEISAVSASTDQAGIVELATNTESNTNTITDKAITPAGLAYALGQNISTPNLQNVTTQGNVTTDDIGIGGFDLINDILPDAPLHIKNSDTLKAILENNSSTKSELKFSDSASTSLYVGTNNGFGYVSQSSGNLSDAGISIKQTNGNVAIGATVDDTQKLKVGGALLATGNISSSLDVIAVNVDASGDVTAGANITLDADVGTVFATNATFSSGLDVTTGTSSLDGGIHVGDNFTISNTGTIAGTGAVWQGSVIASAYLDSDTAHLSGVQTFSGAKTFSQNVTALDFVLSGSDRKLKDNIQPIQKDSFDFEFKQYNYKGKDDLRYGVIAQDIEEKHPEFVKETEDGIKTVSYIDLLVAKVAELENRIKDLENANT